MNPKTNNLTTNSATCVRALMSVFLDSLIKINYAPRFHVEKVVEISLIILNESAFHLVKLDFLPRLHLLVFF